MGRESQGWAAKELSEKGLKVLLLERGPDVKHIEGYSTALLNPWDFPYRGRLTTQVKEEYPVQARKFALTEATTHLMTRDIMYPYEEKNPFNGLEHLLWGDVRWYGDDKVTGGVITTLKRIYGTDMGSIGPFGIKT